MRLIDADALKTMAYRSTDWSHGEHPLVVEVDDIDNMPTIDTQPNWISTGDDQHIVRCKDCALRGSVEDCPMCYEIERIWDVDGWDETTWETVDCTQDDGFCHNGRLENETD